MRKIISYYSKINQMKIKYPDEWDPSQMNEMSWWMWILVVIVVGVLYMIYYY